MADRAHSPAPWRVEPVERKSGAEEAHALIRDADGTEIATVWGVDASAWSHLEIPQAPANAALMAEAPALREQIDLAKAEAENHLDYDTPVLAKILSILDGEPNALHVARLAAKRRTEMVAAAAFADVKGGAR